MPIPMRAPVIPPTLAPTAAPPRAAMIGPAAMNGPTPGMASEPIPASQPSVPPSNPPRPAPVAVPSGALVLCSWAKSRVPVLSGNSTEMSLLLKPPLFRSTTIRCAWPSVLAMQKTACDMIPSFVAEWLDLVALDLELVVDALHAAGLLRDARDG